MPTAILASFVPTLLALGTWLQPFLRRNGPKTRHAAGGRPQRQRHQRSHARCWWWLPKLGERLAPGAQGRCQPPWGVVAEPRWCVHSRFGGGGFHSILKQKTAKNGRLQRFPAARAALFRHQGVWGELLMGADLNFMTTRTPRDGSHYCQFQGDYSCLDDRNSEFAPRRTETSSAVDLPKRRRFDAAWSIAKPSPRPPPPPPPRRERVWNPHTSRRSTIQLHGIRSLIAGSDTPVRPATSPSKPFPPPSPFTVGGHSHV